MSDALSQPMASNSFGTNPSSAEQHNAPLLQLVDITKRFGGLSAVKDLSFSLQQGEILGVIGPNGAGKSTMVNLIGGSLAPTSGTIFYQGHDINRLPPHRRARLGIARTFQLTQPFIGLDIRENVMVGAFFGQRGLNRTGASRVADEVLERVNLAHKATFKGSQLTIADRKRLEIARALATNPQLLLLDEVMAGLTSTEVAQAVELIQQINKMGVTVLIIEHIVHAIATVSNRILVLHHGQKIAEDEPSQVLSDPKVIGAYLGERYAKERRAE
ncbi:MAG: ABC transporter ATP-binding protein [Ktedonobacteraceae bacterium]|nr:ABC transporter ATP-binding protein [Ktedonobacteraceae bacterium]